MIRKVIAVLAHVDSGKTTLSEALLYKSGTIRRLGRVDHRDSFLDNVGLERDRGITVFSKQAVFQWQDQSFTLLDTPGHVDLSGETERTLSVIDGALLVISGTDGVQSHTRTLMSLVDKRRIPTVVFVNKTDMPGFRRDFVMSSLTAGLGERCVDMSSPDLDDALSLLSEELMEEYLETGEISPASLERAVALGQVIPCFFGSALRLTGIEELLDGLCRFIPQAPPSESFAARVYKLTEDQSGAKMAHLRLFGGTLSCRELLTYQDKNGNELSEKVSRIRIYNGERFTSPETVEQGQVCAVLGLSGAYAGQGLGALRRDDRTTLTPPLTYALIPPEGVDSHRLLTVMRTLEAEDPGLSVTYDQAADQITAALMGEVQAQILVSLIKERFGFEIALGEGKIAYRETIAAPVAGAGHFEPLRHYAEVHLRLEPAEPGSGLHFSSECSEDLLARSWQRLILTHLKERLHKGVLTGSPITDMNIILTAGKAHLKHTEGGDFRQATYRAVRQGLRQAESRLLEPWYSFRLEVPAQCLGRAVTDLERLGASLSSPDIQGEQAIITGTGPVSRLRSYHTEVAGYTKGEGHLSCIPAGYGPCLDPEAVIAEIGYDPDADLENTADSVFCSHGAGHTVPWDEAGEMMHVSPEVGLQRHEYMTALRAQARDYVRRAAADEELMEIFQRTYGTIQRREREALHTPKEPAVKRSPKPRPVPKGPEIVIVDGYNVIFSWEELKKLADRSLDLARSRLMDRLSNYQGFRQCVMILVFDAYRTKDPERIAQIGGLSVVYTREAETADTYIERTAHKLLPGRKVRVVTSDGWEQAMILGSGGLRVSAREFLREIEDAERTIRSIIE